MYRPFVLTGREPIIMMVAVYLTVIDVVLFTFLNRYTFVFRETYGFSQELTGLTFVGIGVGLYLATLLVPLLYRWAKSDLAKVEEQGGTRLPPEFRLWYAMLGAPAIPISLLWMGWTAYPEVSYRSPLAASVLFGYGILTVFISSYQYVIDSCEAYAASVTLIRDLAAGGMVEAAIPIYKHLGVHWTLTITADASAAMVPMSYLFYGYGEKIRGWSKYVKVDR